VQTSQQVAAGAVLLRCRAIRVTADEWVYRSMQVRYLLESGQDPTQCDARGRPPYLLATDKAVRDAFRRWAEFGLRLLAA
jgi:hypothetical protein